MKSKLPQHKQRLGKLGEDIAASYLQKQGYHILIRNYRIRYGEIDIVCTKDNVLIFVEVKTRIGNQYGSPEESVTPRKLQDIKNTSEMYTLSRSDLPEAHRIDVIAIELDSEGRLLRIEQIRNVTG